MKHTKRLASVLLALVMAMALMVPALAAGFEPSETAIVYFGGSAVMLAEDDEAETSVPTYYKGYQLMTLKTALVCDSKEEGHKHGMSCYSYAYTVNPKYATILLNAANKVKSETAESVTEDTLIDFLGTMDDDMTRDFADEVYRGIKAANLSQDAGPFQSATEIDQGYWLFVPVISDNGTWKDADGQKVLLATKGLPELEVEPKPTGTPDIDKKINGNTDTDYDTTGLVKYNNTSVGDEVPYILTSKVPDMTSYTKYYFVVNDTLSKGLTFNDDVAITVGSKTLTKDTDFTVTATVNTDRTTSVEIVFTDFIQYKGQAGDDITITYSATVNQDAVIGVAGNPNKVTLIYSNNPYVKDDGAPGNPDKPTPNSPTGKTPEKETRTYVTAIELTKIDPTGKTLTGAKFSISGTRQKIVIINEEIYRKSETGTYYRLKDGTYTETAPTIGGDTDNSDSYDSTTVKYEEVTVVNQETTKTNITAEGYVNASGVLTFEGLSAGTYTITELVSPYGYNLLKDPLTVVITFTEPAANAATPDCTWSATVDKDGEGGNNPENATVNNGIIELTVLNNAGPELPTTGGMGTTIFYVVGAILVLGAVVLLVTKKRMGDEK